MTTTPPLRKRRNRAETIRAYALIAPLMLLLIGTFLIPLGFVVTRSVLDTELDAALPATGRVLAAWDGRDLPPPGVFDALTQDLKAVPVTALNEVSRRLSYENAGFRALLAGARRTLGTPTAFADPRWKETATWQAMKRATGPANAFYLLTALDLRRDFDAGPPGVAQTPSGGVYRDILMRTLSIATVTTLICVVLAFPLCAFLARRSERTRNLLLFLVLLPFWTATLVRTTAWMVLLQDRGVVNQMLLALGAISEPLHLMYNRLGVIIAMVHVMLPFMIFPLLASMRAVDARLMRAAASLGAGPWDSFRRVYLPQVLPGLMAGSLMVFIVTLGFYITPTLLGGPGDQMISFYIAQFTTGTLNWGLAAALSVILLIVTGGLYALQTSLNRRYGGAR